MSVSCGVLVSVIGSPVLIVCYGDLQLLFHFLGVCFCFWLFCQGKVLN